MATPYTPASSLLSPGRIGQQAWVAAIARHNSDEAAEIVSHYHEMAPVYGLNPDLALAQGVVECAWFTSALWRMYRNPCGLGITGPGVYGKDYDTPRTGILAHLQHLCCYAYSAATCPVDDNGLLADPRHHFHDNNPRLSHLQEPPPGRQWATGPGYVGKILAIANALLLTQETSMDALAKLADRQVLMPASNANWGKTTMRGGWPSWITVHETGNRKPGANAIMHANFVKNGGGDDGVSFHACVDEKESIQIMPWNWVAWHASDGNGDGNYDSIAIETCQIGNFAATVRNLANLIARLMREFAIPLDHVVQHNHWAPDKKNCPEFLRASNGEKWKGLVAAVRLASQTTNPHAGSVVEAPATPDPAEPERRALLAFADTLPLVARGKLTREGVADLSSFGGGREERLALYERLVAHRLAGANYVLTLSLWDQLRQQGKITLY